LKNQDGSEADAALDSDPSDTRSQDEILEELFAQTDGPVVVRLVPGAPILYKETAYPQLLNQPHVLDVLFVSIVHWLDISEDGSLCMIGQYFPDLDPAAISEGRWYEDETECCVNRAEYKRLLADPESGFTGIGDTVTYTEPDFHLPANTTNLVLFQYDMEHTDPQAWKDKENFGVISYIVPISKSFTVVGVVEDEGEYADPAFGVHHVYALTDTVGEMLANYRENLAYNSFNSRLDLAIYQPTVIGSSISGAAVYRPDPNDPDAPQIRCAEDQLYPEAEWDALFQNAICNAGYIVEVTLDSGKGYAAYAATYRSNRYHAQTAKHVEDLRLQSIEGAYETYEYHLEKGWSEERARYLLEDHLARLEKDPTISRLEELGEDLEKWRICAKCGTRVRPLRVEE